MAFALNYLVDILEEECRDMFVRFDILIKNLTTKRSHITFLKFALKRELIPECFKIKENSGAVTIQEEAMRNRCGVLLMKDLLKSLSKDSRNLEEELKERKDFLDSSLNDAQKEMMWREVRKGVKHIISEKHYEHKNMLLTLLLKKTMSVEELVSSYDERRSVYGFFKDIGMAGIITEDEYEEEENNFVSRRKRNKLSTEERRIDHLNEKEISDMGDEENVSLHRSWIESCQINRPGFDNVVVETPLDLLGGPSFGCAFSGVHARLHTTLKNDSDFNFKIYSLPTKGIP